MLEANSNMLEKMNDLTLLQLCEVWEWTENQIESKENVIIRNGIIKTLEQE